MKQSKYSKSPPPPPPFHTCTRSLFVSLIISITTHTQRKQAEPDADVAVKIGVENSDTLSSEFNQTPLNMLRAIPGINARNYRHVVLKVSNLRELSGYTLEQCKALVGNENGTKIFNFFRTDMLYKDVM